MNKNRIPRQDRKYTTSVHRPYNCVGSILWFFFLLIGSNALADDKKHELVDTPLEKLLNLALITASKIACKVSDAPSAVGIVTADDIKAYGYRMLRKNLNNMLGLNITIYRTIDYLSDRCFSSPGEYSVRFMLLIDGMQFNDNVYNQPYFEHSGLIDTDLIERADFNGAQTAVPG